MKILMVLNSRRPGGSDASDAGVHLRDFAVPYYVLSDAGAVLTLAERSEAGPARPARDADSAGRAAAVGRFTHDAGARAALAGMRQFSSVATTDFDAVFYPAGPKARWEWRPDH